MVENVQSYPTFLEKAAQKSEQLLSFRYVAEPGAEGKLIFYFPGIGGNMRGQERTMRRIKNENHFNVAYNSITTSLTDVNRQFTTDSIAIEAVQTLKQHQPQRVIFYGSSFGAGCAIATAQYIYEQQLPIQLDAILVLMPCINDENIRLGTYIVPAIKQLPEPLGVAAVRGLYLSRDAAANLQNEQVEKIAPIRTQYRSIMAIPRRDNKPIPSVPVYAYFSTHDKAIDNDSSLRDLQLIAGKDSVFIDYIDVNGARNHNFNPGEFELTAQQKLLPAISQVWTE